MTHVLTAVNSVMSYMSLISPWLVVLFHILLKGAVISVRPTPPQSVLSFIRRAPKLTVRFEDFLGPKMGKFEQKQGGFHGIFKEISWDI